MDISSKLSAPSSYVPNLGMYSSAGPSSLIVHLITAAARQSPKLFGKTYLIATTSEDKISGISANTQKTQRRNNKDNSRCLPK
jgi:hypothetical protein